MIKFGIVGLGSISHKFARDIKLAENAELYAVASRSIEKAKAFANEYDVKHFYGSYEALIGSGIDAVYIATPHNFHKENSLLFLENNIHVLCEKPITVNKQELEELIASAKRNNVLLMEAMWSRYLPALNKVSEIIKETDFQTMRLNFGYQLSSDYPKSGRLLDPNLAAGSTLDLGVYPVSIMKHLTDKEIVSFKAQAVMNDTGIDMDTKVEVTFKDNTKAYLHCSMLENLDGNSYIMTDKGMITIHNLHSSESFSFDREYHYPYKGEGFTPQIESFSNTVIKGLLENDVMTYNASLEVMSILDNIRRQINLKYPFE